MNKQNNISHINQNVYQAPTQPTLSHWTKVCVSVWVCDNVSENVCNFPML